MINEYKFRGRLNKCFNSDKIYIDESRGSWSKKFDNVIKNCLISNGVVQKSNFDLSYLHENVSNNFMKTDTAGDGISNLGKLFYEIKDEKYFDLYHSFLYWLRYKILKCDFYFQKTPTIRFWFAGQKTLPRYHTDIDLGHPPQEINIWWAFTKNKNTGFVIADNLSDCERWYGAHDFDRDLFWKNANSNNLDFNKTGESITTKANSNLIYMFDSRLIHSAIDRSGDDTTRVSIDVRVNPVEDFKSGYSGGNSRMSAKFEPGGLYGYHEKSIDQLWSKK